MSLRLALTDGSALGGDDLDPDSDGDSWLFGEAPANASEKIIDPALAGLQVGGKDALKEEIARRLTTRNLLSLDVAELVCVSAPRARFTCGGLSGALMRQPAQWQGLAWRGWLTAAPRVCRQRV